MLNVMFFNLQSLLSDLYITDVVCVNVVVSFHLYFLSLYCILLCVI